MTFEEWANGKATWEMSAKDIWDAAYAAGREAMRQECLDACEGTTPMQYTNVFDGKPWETRNDPNWYCFNAIKGIK